MRILQVAPWVTIGGADQGTIDWLRTLSRRGCGTYLLTTQESDNALFGEAERWAEEAWCLPELMPGREMPGFILRFVASRRIDVVHVMNSKLGFDLLPALRARFPRVPTVVQLHAEEGDGAGYPPYVATRLDAEVEAYSLVSRALAARMASYGVAESKLHVIYLGVDAATFDPEVADPALAAPPGGLQILFPHRLSEQKDPLLMVEVAAALRQSGCDAVVHVVGDGELRSAVEEAVRRMGLDGRVLLHGAQRDMAAWYRATDVTLLTSRFEGVPLVAYEAMAMERPLVAADVGAVAELVDTRSGFLIRPRDSVAEYVAVLRQLAERPDLRRSSGEAGRRRVLAYFTIDGMAAGHERLYASLTAKLGRDSGGANPVPAALGPPLLSLILHPSAASGLAPQTEARFEVSDLRKARGRWLLLWWSEDPGGPLADPALVEKAIQVARHTPAPVFVGLTAGQGHRWRSIDPAGSGAMLGVLVERRHLPRVLGHRPNRWRSFPVAAGGGLPCVPRSLPGGWLTLARLRSRPPSRDQQEGGADWTPPHTAPLWLGVRDGKARLAVVEAPAADGGRWQMVGRLFTRPFWGTVPVVPEEAGVVLGGPGEPVGHVLSTGLPGMVELRSAVTTALEELGVSTGLPLIRGDVGPAWVGLPELPPTSV